MEYILIFIIFFPIIATFLGFFIQEKNIKTYAIFMSAIEFAITIMLWIKLNNSIKYAQTTITNTVSFNFFELTAMCDGISLFLVVLSAFMCMIALISLSDNIKNLKHFILSILFLESTMMGVFLAENAIFFYIFWELSLIPMLYIIGTWGSDNRIYAAIKFFIYTFAGSIFLLLAILIMSYISHNQLGYYSLSITDWNGLKLPLNTQIWLFLAFSISFAIKTPMFPFHTWLPYAHGQAPTVGSVLLAAILLKMGTYGFVRFSIILFPQASIYFADLICILAIIMVIYTSLVAFAQKDIKQVIAYSSIAHMGIIMLGIFSFNFQGITGAIFLMIGHGIVSGGLFMCVGYLYDRRHTKLISEFGGIAKTMPVFTIIFGILMFASIGLPLTIGFVGEFLSLIGAFQYSKIFAIFGGLGIIMGAIYSLNLYKNVFFGEITNEKNSNLKDLNIKEICTILPIVLLVIYLGIFPNKILGVIESGVGKIASIYSQVDLQHQRGKDAK